MRRALAGLLMGLIVVSLLGCEGPGDKVVKAAEIIAGVIPEITGESEQWREEWRETRTELPEDVRRQFDLAFENALAAAGSEFRCNTEFIRSRLKRDLEILVANLRNEPPPSILPQVCQIYPDSVLDLDADSRPKDQAWIRFAGYDFLDANKNPNVRVVMESRDGTTRDLTRCCVDNPTHYLLTVDFDEIDFEREHRRLKLLTEDGEALGLSVAISHEDPEPEPLPDEYWTEQFSEEGAGEMTCRSGFAVAGVACFGDNCDRKELLCRPYTSPPDEERDAFWHPQVISEEQPNASFRTDVLSDPGFIGGLRCSGGFCDNISFFVVTTPHLERTGEWQWKPFFSEESPGSSVCRRDQFVTGLGCRGDSCDNISIHCSTVQFTNR